MENNIDEKVLKKREYNRQRYYAQRDKIKKQNKEYRDKNIDTVREREKQWHRDNQEYLNEYHKNWKNQNIEKQREYHRNYAKTARDLNPEKRIACSLRARCRQLLKGLSKTGTSEELVGCSWEDLKNHLESQFTEGMSWENYGKRGWHIDHVVPLISFNLESPIEQRRAFHYTNLQPLWASDNLKKSDKLPDGSLGRTKAKK